MFFHPGMHPGMFPHPQSHPNMNMNMEQDNSESSEKHFVVIVMAGGNGTRMANDVLPKVLTPLKGKPMLIRIIEQVELVSPKKIIVVTGKHHQLIERVVNQKIRSNINIEFVQQMEALGTGDAIKCCLNKLEWDDRVLILNGDVPCIKAEMIAEFVNECDDAGIISMDMENPFGYGRILKKMKNRQIEFSGIREEKDCSEEEQLIKEVNAGIYFFHSMILKTYIPKITNNNSKNEYYLTDIIEIILQHEDLEFNVFKPKRSEQYQLLGVNTQDELRLLEENENVN